MFVTAGSRTTRLNFVMALNLKSSLKSAVCVSSVWFESHTCSVATSTAMALHFYLYIYTILSSDSMLSTSSALRHIPFHLSLSCSSPHIYLATSLLPITRSPPPSNLSETPPSAPREASDYPSKKLSVDACGLWQRGNGVAKCVVRCVSVRRRGAAAGSQLWD